MQRVGLALISGAVLALELALMRVWAITQYHHLSYLVISTALLGFGASGTLLCLVRGWAARHWRGVSCAAALGFAASVPVCFAASQRLPLRPLELLWVPSSWLWVLVSQLLAFVPFLFGATCIGLLLIAHADRAERWYAANLAGSGLGVVGVVAVSWWIPASWLPAFAAALGLLAAGLLIPGKSVAPLLVTAGIAAAMALAYARLPLSDLHIDEYKTLPGLLRLGGSRIVARRDGPLGRLDVVAGPAIHEVIDLSPAFAGEVPPQMVLASDAGRGTTLTEVADLRQAEFLDWSVLAAPYHLARPGKVLIVGAGGGTDVHLARYHHTPQITALELNGQVADLVRGQFAGAAGDPYGRPEVRLVVAEARGWLERTEERFDLISVPLLDAFAAASAGVYALNESYLYTLEAVERMLSRLTERGVLSVVRWIEYPPRDAIKFLATAVEALRRRGIERPDQHLLVVRLQFAAHVLVSPAPFSDRQIQSFRSFLDSRNFQAVWYPGMPAEEAGHRHELPGMDGDGRLVGRAAIHDAARALLFDDAERFHQRSLFNLRPATDDRPYYFNFFRWKLLPVLVRLGPQAASQMEYGYALLVVTMVQAVVLAAVLVLLPLRWVRRQAWRHGGKLATAGYFGSLGLAYLFLEIAFIQKLSLYLAHPVLAAAAVLGGFLVCSGLGSALSRRVSSLPGLPCSAVTMAVALIVVVGLVCTLGLSALLEPLSSPSLLVRTCVCLVLLAFLAVPMGVPFPQGLVQLDRQEPAYLPWAWGVNGFASVVAGPLAVLLAMAVGFNALVWLSLGLYVVAAFLRGRMPGARGTAGHPA